jgi:hypothetical protein
MPIPTPLLPKRIRMSYSFLASREITPKGLRNREGVKIAVLVSPLLASSKVFFKRRGRWEGVKNAVKEDGVDP